MEVLLILFMIAVHIQVCNCNRETVNELIQHYFQQGYHCREILHALFIWHGIVRRLRQLYRTLGRRSLYRKRKSSNVIDVIEFNETELNISGSEIGYRQMHQRCIEGGLRKKAVATIIKEFRPEGVRLRRRKHLWRWVKFAR